MSNLTDDDDGWAAPSHEANVVRENAVNQSSRTQYESSASKFLLWLYNNKREDLKPDYIELLLSKSTLNQQVDIKTIQQCFKHTDIMPLDFSILDPHTFVMWLLTLKTNAGCLPTASTYNGHRSGLNHLFRLYKQQATPAYEKELSISFKGLVKAATGRKARGETRVKTGKDPLTAEMYRFLSLALLQNKDKECLFAKFFLNLSWNLMCRAANTEFIRMTHLSWDNDALTILFSKDIQI